MLGISGYGYQTNYNYTSPFSQAASSDPAQTGLTDRTQANANGEKEELVSSSGSKDENGNGRIDPSECETCKHRKYQDGSDENVSYKSASHISPNQAGAAVRAHEGEHVSNAYNKAAEEDGQVISVGVSIHMSTCPECGRSYVSGGETESVIKYKQENPYQTNKNALAAMQATGGNMDFAV